MRLLVNVTATCVRLEATETGGRRKEFGGQWVDLYALLALLRTEAPTRDEYVTVEALARIGPWRYKSIPSVGKEVARHLADLVRAGFAGVLAHRGKTRAWRLELAGGDVAFAPDRPAVRAFVAARGRGALESDTWLDELQTLVEAMAALQRGEAGRTLERLDDAGFAPGDGEPALAAWRALLLGRAMLQHASDDHATVNDLCESWLARADAAGRTVGVRLRAALAHRHRFQDPAATLATLTKLAADLELHGDVGSLGAVVNVMGLLARRTGDDDAGVAHHLRAAVLFGIAGDYPSLQAALYNLALGRREALKKQNRPPDGSLFTILELCLLVCATFGVGRDSALAEISGAEWALENGDRDRARAYLKKAETLLATIESDYDQACFREVQARIELACPEEKGDPIGHLCTAESLYVTAGDLAAAEEVRRLGQRESARRKG
ncbi:hypothetical protein WMF38_30120 [Sorangium sp. So ce118]